MEWMDLGNLYDYIHENFPVPWKCRLYIASDIADGVAFLHNLLPPIVHRDLKSPNVVLTRGTKRIQAKLTDFGLSSSVSAKGLASHVVDNPIWLAPEILEKKNYDQTSDIYSVGVILYELLSGKDYMGHIRFGYEIEERVISGERPPLDPYPAPKGYKELLQECWSSDVGGRPTARNVCSRLTSMFSSLNTQELDLGAQKSIQFANDPTDTHVRSTHSLNNVDDVPSNVFIPRSHSFSSTPKRKIPSKGKKSRMSVFGRNKTLESEAYSYRKHSFRKSKANANKAQKANKGSKSSKAGRPSKSSALTPLSARRAEKSKPKNSEELFLALP